MAPFERLCFSALVASSAAIPANRVPFISRRYDDTQSVVLTGQEPPSGYQCYHGDTSNYPSSDDWLSFDKLWDINQPIILSRNGGDTYIVHYILEAILQVAKESRVDARLILAAVMQESSGNVDHIYGSSVDTIDERGLLASAPHSPRFEPSDPQSSILRMIRNGVESRPEGWFSGPSDPRFIHYVQADMKLYHIAHAWSPTGALEENSDQPKVGGATYVNDFANRLVGWDGRLSGSEICKGAELAEST